MAKDLNKGILGINYNSLNLPTELMVKNINTVGKTYYTYSASGVKLKTEHLNSLNLNYVPATGWRGFVNRVLRTNKNSSCQFAYLHFWQDGLSIPWAGSS